MAKREPIPYLRKFRELKHANPHLETEELWRRAGLLIPGLEQPSWADGRASPKPAFYRRDPREKRSPTDN